MVTLATTFIPIKKFLNLQLALSFRVKDLMVLLFQMTNDLIFSCVECITIYYLLSLVCLFTFSFFLLRGRGDGRFSFGPSLSLCLDGPQAGLGWVSLCIYVCFLCNSCYIYVVYLLSWKIYLRQKKVGANTVIQLTYLIITCFMQTRQKHARTLFRIYAFMTVKIESNLLIYTFLHKK